MGVAAIIAVGGNLGEVRNNFISARNMLASSDGISLPASSLLYSSPPMGPADQADYLNAVLAVQTTLAPIALLRRMQQIEMQHGRKRSGLRWGARTLDLDLIAYGDLHMQSEQLTLPHPGLSERLFVLQPLCDIRPDWLFPSEGKTAHQLLERLIATGQSLLDKGEQW